MIRILSFLLFLSGSTALLGQGIDFFHGTWEEALAKAKTEKKLIFVDAYAKWCGPCKRMAANTFPKATVGAFYNENFISVKMDMEAAENSSFARSYPVGSYPTLMFIDENGKIAMKDVGAKDVKGLIELGKRALKANDRSGDFKAEYEEGNRDPEFVLNYIRALNKAGKSSLQITNEFLKAQEDYTTKQNLQLILEGCTECDSRVFELLTKYRKEVEAIEGKEAVEQRIESACRATLRKAIEFKYVPLLEEAKSKMNEFLPAKGAAFAYEADMDYYSTTQDKDNYLKAVKTYAKKSVKKDADALHILAQKAVQAFPKDEKVLDFAADVAEKAAEKSKNPAYYLTWAKIQNKQGNKDKAIKTAQKAYKIAKDSNPKMAFQIDSFINHLKK